MTSQESKSKPLTIRGLDKELYKQARIQALKEGKPVYQFINEALKEKLERRK